MVYARFEKQMTTAAKLCVDARGAVAGFGNIEFRQWDQGAGRWMIHPTRARGFVLHSRNEHAVAPFWQRDQKGRLAAARRVTDG